MFFNWAAKVSAISSALCLGPRTTKHLAAHNCIWLAEKNRQKGGFYARQSALN
jgi:hypothetical protein